MQTLECISYIILDVYNIIFITDCEMSVCVWDGACLWCVSASRPGAVAGSELSWAEDKTGLAVGYDCPSLCRNPLRFQGLFSQHTQTLINTHTFCHLPFRHTHNSRRCSRTWIVGSNPLETDLYSSLCKTKLQEEETVKAIKALLNACFSERSACIYHMHLNKTVVTHIWAHTWVSKWPSRTFSISSWSTLLPNKSFTGIRRQSWLDLTHYVDTVMKAWGWGDAQDPQPFEEHSDIFSFFYI